VSLFARAPSVPDLEEERDSFVDLEVPTQPGNRNGARLYDRDLHELVGKLLAHAAKQAERTKALRAEVRELRIDIRRLTRKQTMQLGGAVGLVELAQWLLERFN
jgi:uncharacterized protein with von Willebrand factor type A (vWA) domain